MADVLGTGEKVPIVKFKRGQFEFFNRFDKQKLYDKARATRIKSYALVKATFIGRFVNQYPINEKEYRAKKMEWLKRFKERKQTEAQLKIRKTDIFRDEIIEPIFADDLFLFVAQNFRAFFIDKCHFLIRID